MNRPLKFTIVVGLILVGRSPALAAPPASDQEAKQFILKMPKPVRESLGTLDWSNGKITDAALGVLPAAKQLGTLKLAKTGVTDAGLVKLKLVKALVYLDLSDTAVTDEGLQVCGQFRALRTVVVTGTKITPDGVRTLRAKRPDIVVRGIVLPAVAKPADGLADTDARRDFSRWSVSLQRYADRHGGAFPADLEVIRKELEDETAFQDPGGKPHLYFKGFRTQPKTTDASTAANKDPQGVSSLTARKKEKERAERMRQASKAQREAAKRLWERKKAQWATRPIAATAVTRQGHRIVLYGDGHVDKVALEDYRTHLARSRLVDPTLTPTDAASDKKNPKHPTVENTKSPKKRSIFDRMREQFIAEIRTDHPDKILTDPQDNITDLLLDGLPIGDGDLLKLKGITHLKHLSLNRTKVTDSGLTHLAGIKTLSRLSLNETAVTTEGVEKLKAVLPKLKIDHPSQR